MMLPTSSRASRKAVQVERVEQRVIEFYEQFTVPPDSLVAVKEVAGEEFKRLHAVAETDLTRSRRRLQRAEDQRRKLLEAVYEVRFHVTY